MKERNPNKEKLIETINILGPWVHGYFQLKSGITIKDSDEFQRARLFHLRRLLVEAIEGHFQSSKLESKTICDVGCNTGYFLFELFKHFNFRFAKGFDPRKTNIDKAKFIAKQFSLPKERYTLSVGNLFDRRKETFDIVIMPGVLHHLDDHILAAKRLYYMTNDLLILETMALPDEVESSSIAKYLELKDDVYKKTSQPIFGVTGLKLESEYLDGATASSGIVTIPSKNAIYLSLFNAGFRDIKCLNVHVPPDLLEGNQPKYRDFCMVFVVAVKPKSSSSNFFEEHTRAAQQDEIDLQVPRDVIEPLYMVVDGKSSAQNLTGEARTIWFGLVRPEISDTKSSKLLALEGKPYYGLLRGFAHQPIDKIRFEFAKVLFSQMDISWAKIILNKVICTPNCDWRSVYRSYHLLCLIALAEGQTSKARRMNAKALKAFPGFFPAKSVREKLSLVHRRELKKAT